MASKGKTQTKRKTSSRKRTKKRTTNDYASLQLLKLGVVVVFSIFFTICNFGLVGRLGDGISNFFFGLFGALNYVIHIFIGGLIIYCDICAGRKGVVRRSVSASFFMLSVGMIFDLVNGLSTSLTKYNFKEAFNFYFNNHTGGGIIGCSIDYLLLHYVDFGGTIFIIIVISIVSIIVFTEKAFIGSLVNTTSTLMERNRENKVLRMELSNDRKLMQEQRREERRREKDEYEERLSKVKKENEVTKQTFDEVSKRESNRLKKEDEAVLRRNKKVVGVTFDTDLGVEYPSIATDSEIDINDDVHEIKLNGFDETNLQYNFQGEVEEDIIVSDNIYEEEDGFISVDEVKPVPPEIIKTPRRKAKDTVEEATTVDASSISKEISSNMSGEPASEYEFPPRELLKKGIRKNGDSANTVRETAKKLQDTLGIFGVEATVTDISQGPTVTRFELQPKLGVKVSRIKSLSDDIKLNLAASEIRIEAPIPGKAAIGIEVPNKEAQPVVFRDLIDTPEYNNYKSDLAFAVGKDIAGKTVVYGIEDFPHLLIAGATGSGKSVCINTLIMSIIYKANPDDVKLVMIDPKVVELSVYNGIPHLLLPVVTDVKKASATLAFAVNEMHDRYNKFAELGVREITGYNRAIMEMGEDSFNKKMPHIVIIVDEVADLMLQERKNVEEAIMSLAQLARAAGIHLIIATQRPSVDVITGIIKANMPSRIAFAVSSNVDSRTILDMGGAEELLGKGDMLFFPKGMKKPVRLQGGFISDKEVNDVVTFLKKHGSPSYDAEIEEKIKSCEKKSEGGAGIAGADMGGDGNDELFVEAGFFIIDSNKASIGMLQRKFKMGFNRAARVMDQLADAGVVGPDLGTKPREILMGRDQFENYLEEFGG